jgi:hypothetical protein
MDELRPRFIEYAVTQRRSSRLVQLRLPDLVRAPVRNEGRSVSVLKENLGVILMLRRTLAPASLFLIGDMSIALAQTSPLPAPRPPAKTETAQPVTDPDLVKFRSAYTSGDGIAYVVINDEKGERIYRYGDASRLTAKKDTRGYMLFTCASPHAFIPQKPEDKTALMKAVVVKAGEPRFAALDAKYVSNCRNPLVKSAIPKGKQP